MNNTKQTAIAVVIAGYLGGPNAAMLAGSSWQSITSGRWLRRAAQIGRGS
mgnify:CR=1 FL=1